MSTFARRLEIVVGVAGLVAFCILIVLVAMILVTDTPLPW